MQMECSGVEVEYNNLDYRVLYGRIFEMKGNVQLERDRTGQKALSVRSRVLKMYTNFTCS